MFDEFLGERGTFEESDYDEYVDGKPREDGIRDFLASRDIAIDRRRGHELGERKNELVQKLIHEEGVEAYDGLDRVPGGGARRRPAARRRLLEPQRRGRPARLGHHRVPRGARRRQRDRRAGPARQARARHVPRGRAPARRAPGPGRGVRGRAGRASRPAAPGSSATWSASTASATATRCASTAPTSSSTTWPSCSGDPHPAFTVEPWSVTEDALNLDVLAQSESVFALSNGHIGLRGNLDEGEPFGLPGTYLNGFYERARCRTPRPATATRRTARPSSTPPTASSSGCWSTTSRSTSATASCSPTRARSTCARACCAARSAGARRAGARSGSARPASSRSSSARSPRSATRSSRSTAARCASSPSPSSSPTSPARPQTDDPRAAAALRAPLVAEEQEVHDLRVVLVHRTRESGLRMAAGMDHVVEQLRRARDRRRGRAGPRPRLADRRARARRSRWSSPSSSPTAGRASDRSRPCATRSTPPWPRRGGPAGTGSSPSQREYLDAFWDRADVEIEGDGELQQAVRFALFHTLQAGARAERRAIPAKGLTGPGYDGHAFWDTETFVLPVLTYTHPDRRRRRAALAPRDARRAQGAREPSSAAGAAFPWRTIRGEECSAYWPAGTAAFHINADIADAVIRYVPPPATRSSRPAPGLELLVETARLWRSLGHHDHAGAFHIDGVTGPDEYSALVDDNVYTNLMAEQNLRAAADIAAAPLRTRRARSASTRRRSPAGATPRATCTSRTTERLRRPPAGRGLHRSRADGLRRARVPAAAALPVLPALPQAGGQAGRPRAGAAAARRPLHATRRRRATSPTTSR